MTTLQLKEIMQNNREASVRCLPNRAFPYNLLTVGDAVEESQVKKDENNTHPGGGISTNNLLNCETFAPSSEGFYRPMNQKDFYLWSASHSDFQKAQEHQFSYLTHFYPMNHEYHLPADYQPKYAPFKMNPQSYLLRHNFQDFQYFVVIDFEATCDKERIPHPQEIIEFPSVLVNSMTGQVEDSFQMYVRPTCNQLLTDFCKELTGIQQMQVDKGVLLSDALLMHDRWLEEKGIKHTNFVVVTWSNWDCRVMLESECRFKRIRKPPYFNRWINLKVPFHEMFGGARCNLKEAVQLAGLSWEGRAHCGLDDAKNTARLLAHLMHRGFRFSVTNSLVSQSVHEGTMQQLMNGQAGPTNQPLNWKHQSWPFFRSNQVQVSPIKEQCLYCYCGVKSSKQVVQLPGPKHGSSFFSCGNWTIAGCAFCPYFEWAA